jgi:hypothetical protein
MTVIGLRHLRYPICFRSLAFSLGAGAAHLDYFSLVFFVERSRGQVGGASDFKTLQVFNSSTMARGSGFVMASLARLALALHAEW